MDLFDISASISLDTNDYEKGIDSAAAKVAELESSMEGAGDSSDELEGNLTSLEMITESSSDEMASLSSAVESYAEVVIDSSDESEDFAEALETAQDESDALADMLDTLADQLGESEESTTGLIIALEDVVSASGDAASGADDTSKSLSDVSSAAGDAAKGLSDTSKAMKDTKDSEQETKKETEETSKTLGETLVSAAEDAAEALISGDGLTGALEAAVENFGTVGKAIETVVEKLGEMISKTASTGDSIDKNAQKVGLSTTAYQQWDQVLQHSGSSAKSLKSTIRNLSDAAEEGNTAFLELGFSMEDVQSWDDEELFENTILALSDMADETERNEAAQELFGSRYQELIPLLNSGSEAIEDMLDEAIDLGIYTEEEVANAAAYQDTLQDMKTAISEIANNISGLFIPVVTAAMDVITEIAKPIGTITQTIEEAAFDVYDLAGDFLTNPTETIDAIIDGTYAFGEAVEEADATVDASAENTVSNMDTLSATVSEVWADVADENRTLSGSYEETMAIIDSAVATSFEDQDTTIEEAAANMVENLEEVSQSYYDAYDAALSSIEGQMTMFDEVEEAEEVNTQTLLENLESQEQYWNDYNANLEDLQGRNIEGLDEMIASINDGSSEAAEAIEAMSNLSAEELEELVAQYQATQEAQEATATTSAEMASGITESSADLCAQVADGLSGLVETAEETGADIDAGIADAMSANSGDVANAAEDVGTTAVEEVAEGAGCNSPSKYTKETGEYVLLGLAEGLDEFDSLVGSSLTSVETSITSWIDELSADAKNYAYDAGANIVKGIAEGITAEAGTATAAINEVADDTYTTFTAYYEEESPSKLMEEAGENITEGLALGIEGETRTAEEAATSVAESTLEAIEDVIDADVLRDDGANAIGGLVEGIREESEIAVDAAETMATEVGEALEGTSEAVAESLTETDELLAEATETQISNLTTTIETVQGIVDEAFATETESVDETVELITEQLDALAESYTEVYESMQSSIEGQASLWDEMEEVTAMSSEDIESALQSQINYWTEYEENLLNLQSRGIEGLNEFVSSVNDGSTQAAAYIAGLAQMSDEQLMYLVNTTYPTLTAAQDTVSASSALMSSGYTSEIAGMVSNVSASIGGLDLSGETYDSAYNTIQGYINGLQESEGTATSEVTTTGDEVINSFNAALGEQSPSVYTQESGQNFVQGFVNGLATFQELVTPSLTTIQEFILQWLTTFGEQVTEIINTTFEPITSMFSTESFGETYDEISGFLEGKWEEFYATLQGWVAILSEYLLAERTLEYTNFTTWVTGIVTYIQTEESLLQTNIQTFVSAINTIVETGESQFLTNMTTTIEQAKQILQDFYDYVEDEWGPQLEDAFYDIGENSIGALQDGMETKFPELYDWIYDSMKDMKDAAAAALDIGSPSKVFMELGAFTAEGFGVGWENEIADVKEQVADDLDFSTASVDVGSSSLGSLARSGRGITVVQNIYSKAQSAADLLREARWQQERAVMTGV